MSLTPNFIPTTIRGCQSSFLLYLRFLACSNIVEILTPLNISYLSVIYRDAWPPRPRGGGDGVVEANGERQQRQQRANAGQDERQAFTLGLIAQATLTSDLKEQWERDLKSLNADNSKELKSELNSLNQEQCRGLKSELRSLNQEHSEGLKSELSSLNHEHAKGLKSELNSLSQEHCRELKGELSSLNQEHAKGLETVHEELAEVTQKLGDFSVSSILLVGGAKEDEIKRLRSQVDGLQGKGEAADRLQGRLDEARERADRVGLEAARVPDLEASLAEAQKQVEDLQAGSRDRENLERLQNARVLNLEVRLSDKQKQVEDLQASSTDLTQEVELWRGLTYSKQDQINNLLSKVDSLDTCRGLIRAQDTELDDYCLQLQELEGEADKLRESSAGLGGREGKGRSQDLGPGEAARCPTRPVDRHMQVVGSRTGIVAERC
ncbi:hypothetical protein BJ170DRAFT_714891 [Xylariales sp. AK1849]|nr:hypothetical protein BJ170DRAFT_714891 [Xylariales sp. AK1849]